MPPSVCVWLMLHIGHPLRLSPLVRGVSSVVRRQWSVVGQRAVPLYMSPRAAPVAARRATGSGGNAVFGGERREKNLDFLLGAQRRCCARGSAGRSAGGARGAQSTRASQAAWSAAG